MSQLAPQPPPAIIITLTYESLHIEQAIRGISHYNELLLTNNEPPLSPSHALIKLQSVLIAQLEPLIREGVANGWNVANLLRLKTEVQDLIDSVDDVPE